MGWIESEKLIWIRKGESNCIKNKEPNQKLDTNGSSMFRHWHHPHQSFFGGCGKVVDVDVA